VSPPFIFTFFAVCVDILRSLLYIICIEVEEMNKTEEIEMVVVNRINSSVVVTDEHSASSYGIPVVLVDGVVYGDNDNIDGFVTGLDMKKQTADLNKNSAEIFNFCIKGTSLQSHEECYQKAICENRILPVGIINKTYGKI